MIWSVGLIVGCGGSPHCISSVLVPAKYVRTSGYATRVCHPRDMKVAVDIIYWIFVFGEK